MKIEELMQLGLSEELAQKVIDKYKNMIPHWRFFELNEKYKALKDQLEDKESQLEEPGQARVNDETITELQEKLDKQKFDHALDIALRDAKAKNPKAVKALLNMDEIKIEDGQLVGFKEQQEVLQESDPYLFGVDMSLLKGRTPFKSNIPQPERSNPWKKDQINLTEQGRIMRQDWALAQRMKYEAGIK